MERRVRIASPSPMDCALLNKETTAKTAGRKKSRIGKADPIHRGKSGTGP
jgi:hypothetical protein